MGKANNKARRQKDRYYHLAKEQGYRARSAFKLIQLNKKFDFLSNSHVLIDLCAAPGGWLQVAAKFMPMSSMIIGVDLAAIRPIPGVITHTEDITSAKCRQVLRKDLGTRRADVVLHDGAPNVGADWLKDAFTQSELTLHSLKLATEFLREGGVFVTKVFRSADYHSLLWVFHQLFERVDATKPHSSRTQSAEIFVVCRGYKAPARIDPKFLDPKYVFEEVEEEHKPLSVLHPKADERRRFREGYNSALGPLLRRVIPVRKFILARDPIAVLSEATELSFTADKGSRRVNELEPTSEEVRACCADLRVLGKKEFRALLKWRLQVIAQLGKTKETLEEDDEGKAEGEGDEEEESGGSDDDEEGEEGEEDEDEDEDEDGGGAKEDVEVDEELADALARKEALAEALDLTTSRAKREKKKAAKMKSKALRRRALGMDGQAVELQDDHELFSLRTLEGVEEDTLRALRHGSGSVAALESALRSAGDVVMDDEAAERAVAAELGVGLSKKKKVVRMASGEDSEEEYLQSMEDNMDELYTQFVSKRLKRDAEAAKLAEAGKVSHGVKMTRRERLEAQAHLEEEQHNAKLDFEHQKYLRMLAKARGKKDRDSDGEVVSSDSDSDSDSEDEEDEDEDEDAEEEAKRGEDGEEDGAAAGGGGAARGKRLALQTRANRWFSQGIFSDALADEATEEFAAVDDDDEDESGAGVRAGKAAGKRRGGEDEDDGLPDFMRGLPKSERELRKEKLKKGRERIARREERQKKREEEEGAAVAADFEIVRQDGTEVDLDDDEDDDDGGDDGGGRGARDDVDDLASSKARSLARKQRSRTAGKGEDGEDGEDGEEGADGSDGAGKKGAKKGVPAVDPVWEAKEAKRRELIRQGYGAAAAAAAVAKKGSVSFADDVKKGRGSAAAATTAATADDDEDGDASEADGAFEVVTKRESRKATPARPKRKSRDEEEDEEEGEEEDGEEEDGDVSEEEAPDAGTITVNKRSRADESGKAVTTAAGVETREEEDDDEDSDSDAASEASSVDPRTLDYDSDTHAEMLALAKLMRRHTKAKELVDAAYNRYAFNDPALPKWFADDEAKHFRPQLPISRDDVEKIKARFRDLAARPIHKVAEARARKKRRAQVQVDKMRKAAASIQESADLDDRAKLKALQKAYKGGKTKKPTTVFVVGRKGGGAVTVGKKAPGAKVKMVDRRMKKETRALKKKAKGNTRRAGPRSKSSQKKRR